MHSSPWGPCWVLALGAALLSTRPGAALTSRGASGDAKLRVGPAETVDDDLALTGQVVDMEGTVHGDLLAVGDEVVVRGHVAGDLLVLARKLRLDGRIDGSVWGAGGDSEIGGSIAKDCSLFAWILHLLPQARIGRDGTFIANEANIDGRISRDLDLTSHRTSLSGTVLGSSDIVGESLRVGAGARAGGPLTCHCRLPPDVAAGAHLASPPAFIPPPKQRGTARIPLVAPFVLGILLLLIVPAWLPMAGTTAWRRPVASLASGVATAFGDIVLSLVLLAVATHLRMANVVWLAAVALAILAAGALAGFAAIAIRLGELMSRWIRSEVGAGTRILFGLSVLVFLDCLPGVVALPVVVVLSVAGVGALARTASAAWGMPRPAVRLTARLRELFRAVDLDRPRRSVRARTEAGGEPQRRPFTETSGEPEGTSLPSR